MSVPPGVIQWALTEIIAVSQKIEADAAANAQTKRFEDLERLILQQWDQWGLITQTRQLAIMARLNDLLAAVNRIGSPQQTGQPVTLPAPPPGYGGASADDVWAKYNIYTGHDTLRDLAGASAVAEWTMTHGGAAYAPSPWFRMVSTDATTFFNLWQLFFTGPVLDFAAVAPGQSRDDALTAQNPWYSGWYPVSGYPGLVAAYDPLDLGISWVCQLTEAQFQQLVANQFAPSAPVWPGIDHVTLGTTVSMTAPGGAILTPCDGVLVDITGVPSWAGSFAFGGATSWRNIGAVAFTTDDGAQEFPQTLGFASAVYCPKTMSKAAGLVYRIALGASGNLTPFDIN